MRPSWIEFRVPFVVGKFGVKWHVYEPDTFASSKPWVDGPFCPKCGKELEDKNDGFIFKRNLWICHFCKKDYVQPKGDLKDQVKKAFIEHKRGQE